MSLDARTMLSVIRQKVAEHGEKEHFMAEDGNPQPSPPLTPPPLAAGGGKVSCRPQHKGDPCAQAMCRASTLSYPAYPSIRSQVGDRRKRGGSRAFAEPAGAEDGQGDEE